MDPGARLSPWLSGVYSLASPWGSGEVPATSCWVTAGSYHCNIFQLKAKPRVPVVVGFPFDVVSENTTNP